MLHKLIVEIRSMTTMYYILSTQSVIIPDLVRIELSFSHVLDKFGGLVAIAIKL